ncbi:autophagy-related protein 16 [Phyllosticta citribraziliensis]|uniref:Autophagy-related protein 16 n=1 Tax=Phyllosticta citribraziliensis TaxID=989973 RepID=A0ABR1MA95_9PEZI
MTSTHSWLSDYTSALTARDRREKSQEAYILAYTKIADRTARLEAERLKSPPPSTSAQSSATPSNKPHKPSPSRFGRSSPASAATEDASPTDAVARLRADLATTQTSRAQLQTQVSTLTTELASVRGKYTQNTKRVEELQREKAVLERKLRDREGELRGKNRLVQEVQDELVSLNLQFNMAEQKADELGRENQELVERWVKYKEKEAERMNDLSKWE